MFKVRRSFTSKLKLNIWFNFCALHSACYEVLNFSGNKHGEGGDEDAKEDISMKINKQDPEAGQNQNEYVETGWCPIRIACMICMI